MALESYPGKYTLSFVPSGSSGAAKAVGERIPLGSTIFIDRMAPDGSVPVKVVGPTGATLIQGLGFYNQSGGVQLVDSVTNPAEILTFAASLFIDSTANSGAGYKFLYGFCFIGDPEAAGGWGAEGG